MLQLVLTSSNYNACMGAALTTLSLYLYGMYQLGLQPFWNITGIMGWTFTEYILHRYILHYTNDGTLYYYLHGKHHIKPLGKSIHVPILYTLISNAFVFYLLSHFSYGIAVNLLGGHQLSYILFEHIHLDVHHPTWIVKNDMFRTSHMYHHTRNKQKAFAFTAPTWDILFNTFPDDILTYNWFAFVPIPVLSFYFGTAPRQSQSPPHSL